jgi:hypothetical protein
MALFLRQEMSEYLRPWKIVTLGMGLAALIAGALYYQAADWDIWISLIMGGLAYLTAPWNFQIVQNSRWRLFPLGVFAYWFTVDGSYVVYNTYSGHEINTDLRWANFFASSLLYFLCGWLWSPRMTFRELVCEIRRAIKVGLR